MKKWEMPKVKIDQFAANEYVSACTPIPFAGNPQYAYVDWNPKDEMISSSGGERLKRSSETGHYSVNSDVPYGFYNDVTVYKVNPETGLTFPPSGSHALNEMHTHTDPATWEKITVPLFVEVGTYDIYVGSTVDVQVYPSSQWNDGTTTDKTYS